MKEPELREEEGRRHVNKPAPRPMPDPETEQHPAPGIEHEPEPDAENIIPAKDRPGTL